MNNKRARRERVECPICFDAITARTEARPFSCDHLLCATCHKRMIESEDNRCPTCRAPRLGFTQEEAEPPPDRNNDAPMLDLPLVGFEHFVQQAPQSMAAGLYGRRAGIHRPNTGHVMHFPIEAPQEILNFGRSLGLTEEDIRGGGLPGTRHPQSMQNIPSDILASGLLGMAEQADYTLAALSTTLPTGMIDALLNLPAVPSMQQWHAMSRNAITQPPPRRSRSNSNMPARQGGSARRTSSSRRVSAR